jgi:hypothetical protein
VVYPSRSNALREAKGRIPMGMDSPAGSLSARVRAGAKPDGAEENRLYEFAHSYPSWRVSRIPRLQVFGDHG